MTDDRQMRDGVVQQARRVGQERVEFGVYALVHRRERFAVAEGRVVVVFEGPPPLPAGKLSRMSNTTSTPRA